MTIAPEQLDALRPHLLRFAQLQLRDPALAEDVVADTVLAVLEHPERFAGNASLKTYVIGILKHKIIDAIRSGRREVRVSLLAGGASDETDQRTDEAVFDALFAADGHYLTPPSDWGNPDAALSRREFFDILQMCVDRVFMMREWLELETDEICQELEITATNAWALLYRARMRLRACLDLHWFGNQGAAA
ncbi:sigma-70 family RNA polymerase sigma factor [Ralstonia nicotianae]